MHPYLAKYLLDPKSPREAAGEPHRLFRRWFAAAHRRWQRRRMIAALQAMDDRLLRDIGIHRGEIGRVVDRFDDRELGMTPLPRSEPAAKKEDDLYREAA